MNFVADESVDAPVVHLLRNNHDVIFVLEKYSGASDDFVLQLANQQNRILITQDKDFGELVFRLGKIHSGIILFRLEGLKPEQKAKIVAQTIQDHSEELNNSFTVIQPHLIRIRKRHDQK